MTEINDFCEDQLALYPPRFRSLEDAEFFMECYRSGWRFPPEKMIHPFLTINGVCCVNEEYQYAPFELSFTIETRIKPPCQPH